MRLQQNENTDTFGEAAGFPGPSEHRARPLAVGGDAE